MRLLVASFGSCDPTMSQKRFRFRLFIDLLKLGPSNALKLKNFRVPTSKTDAGDFAAVLFTVIKDRAYEGEKVTVDELNQR